MPTSNVFTATSLSVQSIPLLLKPLSPIMTSSTYDFGSGMLPLPAIQNDLPIKPALQSFINSSTHTSH